MVNILLKIILSKFFLFSSLIGKNGSLSGAVRGDDGALPGANVFLVGTSMGAVTDSLGNYKIDNIPVGKYVLRANYIGYQPDETEIYISVLQENNADDEDFSSSFTAKLGLEDDEFIEQIKKYRIWNPTMSEKYREIDIMPYYLILQILLEVPKNSFTKDEYVLFITKIKSHEKSEINNCINNINMS